MNNQKRRQELCRSIAKTINAESIDSFELGVRWADFNPDWREDIPKYEVNIYGLPKLYLCQILTLDPTFDYRYSYRVGFITKEGNWNINNPNTKVMRYLEIFCEESMNKLVLKDIPKFKNETNEDEKEDEETTEYKKVA
jgi:hypothetical protein